MRARRKNCLVTLTLLLFLAGGGWSVAQEEGSPDPDLAVLEEVTEEAPEDDQGQVDPAADPESPEEMPENVGDDATDGAGESAIDLLEDGDVVSDASAASPAMAEEGGPIPETDDIESGDPAPVPLPEEGAEGAANGSGLLSAINAGAGPGEVEGEVFDEESGEGLPGAFVSVPALDFRVRTDDDGRYSIKGLPLGPNILKFTKSGYVSAEQEVDIANAAEAVTASKGLAVRPIELDDSEYLLEDYEFVAEYQEEEVGGIVFERESTDGLVSGVGKELFSKTGVSDAADAVTKISGANIVGGRYAVVRGLGDRYTNTTVNRGIVPSADPSRKAVQLDLFPTDLLQSVNIYKTFVPNLPAEFVGGLIAVETLSLPEDRTLVFSLSTGWHSETSGLDTYLGVPGRDIDFFASNDDDLLNNPAFVGRTGGFPPGSRFNPVDRMEAETARRIFYDTVPLFAEQQDTPSQDYSLGLEYGNRFDLSRGWDLGVVASFTRGEKSRYKEKGVARVSRTSLLTGDVPGAAPRRFVPTFVNTSTGVTVGLGTTLARTQEDFGRGVDWGMLIGAALEQEGAHKISGTFFKYRTGDDTVKLTDDQLRTDDSFAGSQDVIFDNLTLVRGGETVQAREYWQTLETVYRDLQLVQLGGEHDFRDGGRGVKLDWFFGNSQAEEVRPRDVNLRFFSLTSPTIDPLVTVVNPVNTSNAQSSFVLGGETKDQALQLKTDTTFSLLEDTRDDRKLDVRLGVGNYTRTREADARRLSFNLGGLLLRDILRSGSLDAERDLTDDLREGDGAVVVDGQLENRSEGWIVGEASGSTNLTFDGSSEIISAYSMLDAAWGPWTLVGGARWESETRGYTNAGGDSFEQTTARVYPGVVASMDFGPDDKFGIDLAWSRTVARPTFYEFVDAFTLDQANDETFAGNPGLRDTLATNYDVRFSYAGDNPTNAASLGLFHKSLVDPIVQVQDPFTSGDRITWTNFPEATLTGVEVDLSRDLGAGFQVFGNLSYIHSEVPPATFFNPRGGSSATIESETLEGQPNWLANLVLSHYYEPWELTTSLSYNFTGSYLRRLVPSQGATAANPAPPNIIRQPFHTLDFVVSKNWQNDWTDGKVGFKIKNILGSKEEFTYGDLNILPFETYEPGTEVSVSVDMNF